MTNTCINLRTGWASAHHNIFWLLTECALDIMASRCGGSVLLHAPAVRQPLTRDIKRPLVTESCTVEVVHNVALTNPSRLLAWCDTDRLGHYNIFLFDSQIGWMTARSLQIMVNHKLNFFLFVSALPMDQTDKQMYRKHTTQVIITQRSTSQIKKPLNL